MEAIIERCAGLDVPSGDGGRLLSNRAPTVKAILAKPLYTIAAAPLWRELAAAER